MLVCCTRRALCQLSHTPAPIYFLSLNQGLMNSGWPSNSSTPDQEQGFLHLLSTQITGMRHHICNLSTWKRQRQRVCKLSPAKATVRLLQRKEKQLKEPLLGYHFCLYSYKCLILSSNYPIRNTRHTVFCERKCAAESRRQWPGQSRSHKAV